VIFVAVLSVCAAGLVAAKLAPVARLWREARPQPLGAVVRYPSAVRPSPERVDGNIALLAKVTVSSIDESASAEAGVADGVVDTREWTSGRRDAGAWILLEWEKPALVEEVDLFDLLNPRENVLAGTLSFDDGSSIYVGALPKDGTVSRITFKPKAVSWVKFQIDGAEGDNTGLGEIMVRGMVSQ
jgi:hypothetical protein